MTHSDLPVLHPERPYDPLRDEWVRQLVAGRARGLREEALRAPLRDDFLRAHDWSPSAFPSLYADAREFDMPSRWPHHNDGYPWNPGWSSRRQYVQTPTRSLVCLSELYAVEQPDDWAEARAEALAYGLFLHRLDHPGWHHPPETQIVALVSPPMLFATPPVELGDATEIARDFLAHDLAGVSLRLRADPDMRARIEFPRETDAAAWNLAMGDQARATAI